MPDLRTWKGRSLKAEINLTSSYTTKLNLIANITLLLHLFLYSIKNLIANIPLIISIFYTLLKTHTY